jgi:hypothetical protein
MVGFFGYRRGACRRLLVEVRARRIDVVVVYKVDRRQTGDWTQFAHCRCRGRRRSERLLKMRLNTGGDLASGDRPAEKEPLGLVAIGHVEKGRLLAGLDALDRHPHMQLVSERDDCCLRRLPATLRSHSDDIPVAMRRPVSEPNCLSDGAVVEDIRGAIIYAADTVAHEETVFVGPKE